MSGRPGIQEVGAFEAKTHLSRLLDAVERGERVIITRHGKRVAIMEPARADKKAVFGCAKGPGFDMAPDFDEPLAERRTLLPSGILKGSMGTHSTASWLCRHADAVGGSLAAMPFSMPTVFPGFGE